MKSFGLFFFFLATILGMTFLQSCIKDPDFYTGNDVRLTFSTDTLRFDTVFTTQGSSTRLIKVFNSKDKPIRIERIQFRDAGNSIFRMNVDGVSGDVFTDVEILAEDSIYLFVEVTIDPDQPVSLSPFVISDAIQFRINGTDQEVILEAWGQNAIYIPNNSNSKGVARLTCDNMEVIWDDPRPYVIFGVLLIDSCTLRILVGTRVHLHGGVVPNGSGFYTDGLIYTQPDGRIRIEGSLEKPVIFRSDRLESAFATLPGQWGGIRLGPNSKGNVFEHVQIYNPIVGVLVDSNATLDIRYAKIAYTSGSALSSYAGDIRADNVLMFDNVRNGVQLALGGTHRFRYCTIANFGNTSEAVLASNIFCLDPLCSEAYLNTLSAEFINCIVTGNQKDEITLVDGSGGVAGAFNYQFTNSLVRIEDLLDEDQWPDFLSNCLSCIQYTSSDKLFIDLNEGDFHLDSLAVVRNKALPLNDVLYDLDGVLRNPVNPDIGCYEFGL